MPTAYLTTVLNYQRCLRWTSGFREYFLWWQEGQCLLMSVGSHCLNLYCNPQSHMCKHHLLKQRWNIPRDVFIPENGGLSYIYWEVGRNCTCTVCFSLIRSFFIHENWLLLTLSLLGGLKNFNGVEAHYKEAVPDLVNKLHVLNKSGQTYL